MMLAQVHYLDSKINMETSDNNNYYQLFHSKILVFTIKALVEMLIRKLLIVVLSTTFPGDVGPSYILSISLHVVVEEIHECGCDLHPTWEWMCVHEVPRWSGGASIKCALSQGGVEMCP